jgi:hypothetical protein
MTATAILAPVKTCTKCKECKPATTEFFYERTDLGKTKLMTACKDCKKKSAADCYGRNPEKAKAYMAEYQAKNYDRLRQQWTAYANANKDRRSAQKAIYRLEHEERINKQKREYYSNNKAAIAARQLVHYNKNKKLIGAKQKEYRELNKEALRDWRSNYQLVIMSDPILRMKYRYRNIISKCVTRMGFTKRSSAKTILGCTWDEFKSHIEKQFTGGMSWEKIGEIHIDHIQPLASAVTEADVVALNHFTNLRPMWAVDNISKGAKITHLI